MQMDTYQAHAERTASMGKGATMSTEDFLALCALGLAGEVGEVVEPIKKHLFHGKALDPAHLAEEMGDVLWYLTTLATTLGFQLSDVAQANVEKLAKRYPGPAALLAPVEPPIPASTLDALAQGLGRLPLSVLELQVHQDDDGAYRAYVIAGKSKGATREEALGNLMQLVRQGLNARIEKDTDAAVDLYLETCRSAA